MTTLEATESTTAVSEAPSKENPMQVRSTIDTSVFDLVFSTAKTMVAFGLVYFMGYYRFSAAWLVMGLMAFILREKYRREKSFKLEIARVASINEKASILARVEDLPSWVYFPDTERAEWVNKILHQLWPHIRHYVKDFLLTNIEPSMQEMVKKTTKFGSFKFDKIDLGEIPLRVGGVKVYREQVSRHEIIMDLEIFYAGNCDLQVVVSKLRAGIRHLQLHGTLRVVFKPLINEIPLIGGLQLFFLNTPDVDFDLTNLADVLDIPGIGEMLRKIVSDQIAALMVLPNKICVKLSDNVQSRLLHFNEPIGVVRINVIEARDLMRKDVGMLGKGKSDPYGIISVGAQEFRTKVIPNTVNPVWDFYCEALVEHLAGQSIILELLDKDQGNEDDSLGRLSVDCETIALKGQTDTWIPLEDAKTGQVHLKLTWLGLSSDPVDLHIQEKELEMLKELGLSTSLLLVYVDSAKHLPNGSKAGIEPNPVVRLSIGSQKRETTAQKNIVEPVWEETFAFHVVNPEIQDIAIEVVDQKSNASLGHMTFGIGKLLHVDDLELSQPFNLKGSGPESKLVLTFRLRILKSGVTVPMEVAAENGIFDSSRSRSGSDSRPDSTSPTPTQALNSSSNQANNSSHSASESIPSVVKAATFASGMEMPANDTLRRRNVDGSPTTDADNVGVGQVQLTLRYSQQRSRLVIVVHKVIELPQHDVNDPPDPYVKLYLNPDKNRDSKRKTQVVKNTCNPVYDESFDYLMNPSDLNSTQLLVTVNNRSSSVFSKSAVLGKIAIDLSTLDLTKAITSWFALDPETNSG